MRIARAEREVILVGVGTINSPQISDAFLGIGEPGALAAPRH